MAKDNKKKISNSPFKTKKNKDKATELPTDEESETVANENASPDKQTTTEPVSSVSVPSVTLNEDIVFLKQRILEQSQEISGLTKRVVSLEKKLNETNETLGVAKHINTILANQVDDVQQYSRRNCLIISGIPPNKDETQHDIFDHVNDTLVKKAKLSHDLFREDFDKAHRIGAVNTNKNYQNIIVRFKSHSTPERVYAMTRSNSDNAKNNLKPHNISIRASLTAKRSKLLEHCQEIADKIENIHFVYSDFHGNLKMRLHNPVTIELPTMMDETKKKIFNDVKIIPFKSDSDFYKVLEQLNK